MTLIETIKTFLILFPINFVIIFAVLKLQKANEDKQPVEKDARIVKLEEALNWIEVESRDGTRPSFRSLVNQKAREALYRKIKPE